MEGRLYLYLSFVNITFLQLEETALNFNTSGTITVIYLYP